MRIFSPKLHRLFEQQAAQLRAAPAVITDDGSVTSYAELNARANAVAWHMRNEGIAAGERVAIMLHRSIDAFTAILATLKVGATFVPIDPSHPAERRSFMLADAGVTSCVGNTPSALRTIDLSKVSLPISPYTAMDISDNLPDEPDGSAIAYVMYTSGSTGRPKGVEVSHDSMFHGVMAMQEMLGTTSADRWMAMTSLSFDPSLLELFAPLACGASLIVAPQHGLHDANELLNLMETHHATVAQGTPSLWRMLLDGGDWRSNITVLCGGEIMQQSLAENLLDRGVRLWNLYGPTEATIWSTGHRVLSAGRDRARIPVGLPIPGSKLYVLDPAATPLPAGEIGEIYIGGCGVAHGYRNRDDLNQRAFVINSIDGERMYRTGDLGRLDNTGLLEFRGRADTQVKLRSYRIELSEIEVAVSSHPSVKDSVVLVDVTGQGSDQNSDQNSGAATIDDGGRLAAFVRPADNTTFDVTTLRGHLRSWLPEYMLPDMVVLVDNWPTTSTGKIDRMSLCVKDFPDAVSRSSAKSPGSNKSASKQAPPEELTPTEVHTLAIWSDVLANASIGLDDDFFSIGGHSLTAMRVVQQLRRHFSKALSAAHIFDNPTVRLLAAAIDQTQHVVEAKSLIEPFNSQKTSTSIAELPLLPNQEARFRQALFRKENGLPFMPHHVTAAFHFDVEPDLATLREAITVIVNRHEALRTIVKRREEQYVQAICPNMVVDIALLGPVTSKSLDSDTQSILLTQARQPFDFFNGPLFRLTHLATSDGSVLLLVLDHFIADGWSVNILVDELSLTYNTIAEHRPASAEAVGSYAEFIRQRITWITSEAAHKTLEQDKQLHARRTVYPTVALPGTRPPNTYIGNGHSTVRHLDSDLTRSLGEYCRLTGTSRFTTLVAAMGLALRSDNSDDGGDGGDGGDVSLLVPVANRESATEERLIGWVSDTAILTLPLAGVASFDAAVACTREAITLLFRDPRLPIMEIARRLDPSRFVEPPRSPFVFVNYFVEGFATEEIDLGESHGKLFDLNLLAPTAPIMLVWSDMATGLQLSASFSGNHYTPSEVESFLTRYTNILKQGLAHPSIART